VSAKPLMVVVEESSHHGRVCPCSSSDCASRSASSASASLSSRKPSPCWIRAIASSRLKETIGEPVRVLERRWCFRGLVGIRHRPLYPLPSSTSLTIPHTPQSHP